MQSKVIKLASILKYQGLFSGYSFRGKINHNKNGNTRVVQLKDFQDNYSVIGDNCILIDGAKIKEKYHLEDGDILFISKGANNFSVVFNNNKDEIPTIASSSLFVIRVDRKFAIPKYISWYINQKKVQNHLKLNLMGTYVPNINKPTVEKIPIELPSLEVQQKIATIADLNNKEQKLYHQIIKLRNHLTQQQLLKTI